MLQLLRRFREWLRRGGIDRGEPLPNKGLTVREQGAQPNYPVEGYDEDRPKH